MPPTRRSSSKLTETEADHLEVEHRRRQTGIDQGGQPVAVPAAGDAATSRERLALAW